MATRERKPMPAATLRRLMRPELDPETIREAERGNIRGGNPAEAAILLRLREAVAQATVEAREDLAGLAGS